MTQGAPWPGSLGNPPGSLGNPLRPGSPGLSSQVPHRAMQSKAKQRKVKQSQAKQRKAKQGKVQSKAKQSKTQPTESKQSQVKQTKANQSKSKQSADHQNDHNAQVVAALPCKRRRPAGCHLPPWLSRRHLVRGAERLRRTMLAPSRCPPVQICCERV